MGYKESNFAHHIDALPQAHDATVLRAREFSTDLTIPLGQIVDFGYRQTHFFTFYEAAAGVQALEDLLSARYGGELPARTAAIFPTLLHMTNVVLGGAEVDRQFVVNSGHQGRLIYALKESRAAPAVMHQDLRLPPTIVGYDQLGGWLRGEVSALDAWRSLARYQLIGWKPIVPTGR